MATIQQSIISRVQPGRFDDFLSLNGEAVKLHERLGVPGARVFMAGPAGESTGTVIFATEHPSMAAYAAYGEAVAVDGEMQSLLARLRSKDSPNVIEQQSLAAEIPLGRTSNPTRGTVVEVHASRALPARLGRCPGTGAQGVRFRGVHRCDQRPKLPAEPRRSGRGARCSLRGSSPALRAWVRPPTHGRPRLKDRALPSSAAATSPVTHVFSAVYSELPV